MRVRGELGQQLEHALGALDHDVGHRHQSRLLVRGGADPQRRQAALRQVAECLEGLHVAEVVTGEEEPAGVELLDQGPHRDPLVHAR